MPLTVISPPFKILTNTGFKYQQTAVCQILWHIFSKDNAKIHVDIVMLLLNKHYQVLLQKHRRVNYDCKFDFQYIKSFPKQDIWDFKTFSNWMKSEERIEMLNLVRHSTLILYHNLLLD
jgi:hypothetical protein